jgi:hypothetical protein
MQKDEAGGGHTQRQAEKGGDQKEGRKDEKLDGFNGIQGEEEHHQGKSKVKAQEQVQKYSRQRENHHQKGYDNPHGHTELSLMDA